MIRHMQNPSYTYDEYLICIKLGPSISSVICKNQSYIGPSYPSSPVLCFYIAAVVFIGRGGGGGVASVVDSVGNVRSVCAHIVNLAGDLSDLT